MKVWNMSFYISYRDTLMRKMWTFLTTATKWELLFLAYWPFLMWVCSDWLFCTACLRGRLNATKPSYHEPNLYQHRMANLCIRSILQSTVGEKYLTYCLSKSNMTYAPLMLTAIFNFRLQLYRHPTYVLVITIIIS